MAEDDSRQWSLAKGYGINAEQVRRKLYYLLSLFLASKGLSELQTDEHWCPIGIMRSSFEHEEIIHLLLDCASTLRVNDDQMELKYGITSNAKAVFVGELYEPEGTPVQRLSFREACNKIMHADHMNFDESDLDVPWLSHLSCTIYLYGTRGKKSWRAVVNVIDWAKAGALSLA